MKNCVGCFFKPFIKLGSFIGFFPVIVKCIHANTKSTSQFSLSRKYLMFSLILLAFQSVNLFFGLYDILKQKNLDVPFTVVAILGIFWNVSCMLTCASGIIKHNVLVLEFREIAKMIENSQEFGFPCFLTAECVKKSKIAFFTIIVIGVLGFLNTLAYNMAYYVGTLNFYYLYKLLNTVLSSSISFICTMLHMMISLFFCFIFRVCYQEIKATLLKKRNFSIKRNKWNVSERVPLEVTLRHLNRLYLAIELMYKQLNIVVNFGFLPWFIINVLNLILKTYLIIFYYNITNNINVYGIIHTYLNMFGIAMYLIVIDRVSYGVSTIKYFRYSKKY